jgi:carbon storage regulator
LIATFIYKWPKFHGGEFMLVLTRKVGEGIKIDEDIFVRIIQVKGKQVRIGIEAPRETRIQREELDLKATDAEAYAEAATSKSSLPEQ